MLPWRFVRILVVLLSGIGSIVFTTFLLVQAAKGHPVNSTNALLAWIGIANVCFVLSGFSVWYDERRTAITLRRDLDSLKAPRAAPGADLRRAAFETALQKLTPQEESTLVQVWLHGRSDAEQTRKWFSEHGETIGHSRGDDLNSADQFLQGVAHKTGLIRVAFKTNAYATYEINPEYKELIATWAEKLTD